MEIEDMLKKEVLKKSRGMILVLTNLKKLLNGVGKPISKS
jgi:hypothetical protein